jgi:hypothetical protein
MGHAYFALFTFIDRLGYALPLKHSIVVRLVFDDGHVCLAWACLLSVRKK